MNTNTNTNETAGKECSNCGERQASTQPREDGSPMCDACWSAALAHGHLHGMHMDDDGRPELVPGCPTCAAYAEEAARWTPEPDYDMDGTPFHARPDFDTRDREGRTVAMTLPAVITVRYSTIDHYRESRRFKTLAGAQKYARRKLGDTFDCGSFYAVDAYGVGKLEANIPITLLMGVQE